MKEKWILFTGVVILTLGIVLNVIVRDEPWPLFLIITGVLIKVYYIGNKIRNSSYKPGYEILLLVIGLMLFLTAVYVPFPENFIHPLYLKVAGISLKATFVVLFIRKIKNSRL